MRIAFVTPEYVTESNFDGGLAQYLHQVSLMLKESGHEPMVIVGTTSDLQVVHDGIPVFRVDVQNAWTKWLNCADRGGAAVVWAWIWQSWKLNRKLLEINRHKKIDVAQFTSYTATAFFHPRFIPSVVRLSSLQSLWDQGYELRKSLTRALMQHLEIKSLKKADRLVSPGRVIAQAVERLTGKQVDIIENPYVSTSPDVDRRPYRDLLEGKVYLLFFGSIGLLKGVKTIADIIYCMLDRYPSLFFVFAGKDMMYRGNPMMNFVWNKAGSHRGRVLYLGILPRGQLHPVIENAQAVVLPSRIDNFPNTCLEAMAHGKIVIGTRGASFEQLINDGQNGFLCEIEDSNSLLNAIENALTLTPDERQKMGKVAKERVNYLMQKMAVSKLLGMYREVACL